jgi:RNA polymerase sigma-70 factor, ECF subfamily
VAPTLRAVCGLSTAEVAAAFVIPEATMAKRLVRAKTKIGRAAADRGRVRPPAPRDN